MSEETGEKYMLGTQKLVQRKARELPIWKCPTRPNLVDVNGRYLDQNLSDLRQIYMFIKEDP